MRLTGSLLLDQLCNIFLVLTPYQYGITFMCTDTPILIFVPVTIAVRDSP